MFPIRHLGRMISELSKAGISLNRIREIMAAPEESDPPDALTPPLDGDIVFDHVSFGYDGCPELLHDVSFTIPGPAIKNPISRIGFLGDHITFGYWFYQ